MYLMPDREQREKGRKRRLRAERFWWEGRQVSLYLFPPGLGYRRMQGYLRLIVREAEGKAQIWAAPELEALWTDRDIAGFPELSGTGISRGAPLPEAELAARLLRLQPFRETLVVLAGRREGQARWIEDFVQELYPDLNGLYLVGLPEETAERLGDFADWLYGESGLVTCFTDTFPEADGRRTAAADLGAEQKNGLRRIPAGALYLDLTSDPAKKRLFNEKRTDISYISARNCLDTAFKARYNAF